MEMAKEQSESHDPELASLYALGALDGPEREGFEAHLADCPLCQTAVEKERAVLDQLLLAVPERAARPGFKRQVLERAAEVRAELARTAPPQPRKARPLQLVPRLALAAVAAIALVIGILAGQTWYGGQALAVSPLTGSGEPGTAQVVLRRSGALDLELQGLVEPGAGKVYEAWIIPPGGQPVAAGTTSSGSGTVHLGGGGTAVTGTVAITIENAPGAAAPSAPPLLSGPVAA